MKLTYILLLSVMPLFYSCNSEEPAETPDDKQAAAASPAAAPEASTGPSDVEPAGSPAAASPVLIKPAAPAAASRVRLETNKGDIVIELDADKAPVTVKNFLGYVERKHYDGTAFHRVIDGFMIQGGGFTAQGDKLIEKRTGAGIKNEGQNGLKNVRGTIAMARTGDPNSATAQFFINVGDNEGLNYPNPDGHGYAVFGKVIEGMDVVEAIKTVPTTTKTLTMLHPVTGQPLNQPAPNVPQLPVIIKSATAVAAE